MLTDTQIRSLKPQGKAFKIADALGLYVTVAPSGTKSFRYDYRLDGKRETVTIGRYEEGTLSRAANELDGLDFGGVISLADARALHDRARRMVKAGLSPSKVKIEKRAAAEDASTFSAWASKYFEFKADPKSGNEQLADSTLALRKSIYKRLLEGPLGKKRLEDIKPLLLTELFKKAKDERGPGPAVHARELVLLVYRYAIGQGVEITNPVDSIQRKTIASFKPRERNLNRTEIKTFTDALDRTAMIPTLRLALRFMLLTMVRKGEFIGATWREIDWDRTIWTIPKEGLELEMMIRHDTSLPLPLFEKLRKNLAEQCWEVVNDPHFTASLEMEDSLMMTEAMSYQDLTEWVAQMIEKTLPGLTPLRS